MHRAYYLAGWGYAGIAFLALLDRAMVIKDPATAFEPPRSGIGVQAIPAGQFWFQGVKSRCNALEVEVTLQQSPPPGTAEGAGYAAACWALAGRIERARETIQSLPEEQRSHAAGIIFEVGHPVADMGDDASAGPIMRLVVAYQPTNYMALYHAGMSYYVLGQHDLARQHLTSFLSLYSNRDGWRSNAEDVLSRIGRAVER